MTIDLSGSGMLAVTRDTVTALRAPLSGYGSVGGGYLQEAYVGARA